MTRDRDGRADDDLFACLLRDNKGKEQCLSHAELAAETAHLSKCIALIVIAPAWVR